MIVTLPPGLIGESISLLRNGEVVGKATITGDTVRIPASLANDESGKLQVSLEPDGSPPVTIDVKSQPTSLSQQCPQSVDGFHDPLTVSGKLDPGFAGAQIKVKYTTPTGDPTPSRTFERTVTTDANGNWSDSIDVREEEFDNWRGDWKIQARYEGDATHAGSTAQECTVNVFDGG